MRIHLILAAAALLSASLAARADDIYTFTVTFPPVNGTYTFDEPSIVTTAGYLSLSDLTSSTGTTLTSLYLDPTMRSCPSFLASGTGYCVEVNGVDIVITSLATITSPGTYGQLAPEIEIDIAATPEPSSFVLLGTGLLGVAGIVRRRLA